jgi:hypothetical protein
LKKFRKVKCGTRTDLAAGHACCEDKDKKGLEKQNEKADFKSTYSLIPVRNLTPARNQY